MYPYFINLIVGLSNIVLAAYLFTTWSFTMFDTVFICTVTAASTLMHLSETKHNLPGLTTGSEIFLNFDRLMAGVAFCYCSSRANITLYKSCLLFTGFFFLIISEKLAFGYTFFAITHITWHSIAYYLMGDALSK